MTDIYLSRFIGPTAARGQTAWTKAALLLDGSSQEMLDANADRVGFIVFNRIGNAVIDIDIAGGAVTAGGGRTITGGNDYYFTGVYCPTGAVTVIGAPGQTITYWEGVKS